MATKVQISKIGLVLACEVSAAPVPRPKQVFPLPDFSNAAYPFLTLALDNTNSRYAIKATVDATLPPGGGDWTLLWRLDGSDAIAMTTVVAGASQLVPYSIPSATYAFHLERVDAAGKKVTYPEVTITTPANYTPSMNIPGAAAFNGTTATVVTNRVIGGALDYTTAGTYNLTVPDGVTRLKATITGGGAGGGAGTTNVGSGGGGGAGATIIDWFDVVPGQTVTIVVGAKGTGGTTSGANGTNGGDSSVTANGRTVTAYGGGFGYGGSTRTGGGANGGVVRGRVLVSQAGGVAPGGSGATGTDVRFFCESWGGVGGAGGAGVAIGGANSGLGGSAYGPISSFTGGTNGSGGGSGGGGGASFWGAGGAGGDQAGAGAPGSSPSATSYGAAGGGGACKAAGFFAGGDGVCGRVLIEWGI